MKETEVRERIEAFLKSTMRKTVIPASLGVGLSLVGCERSSSVPVYSAVVREDAAVSTRDAADASADRLGLPETKYMGPFPMDTNIDRPPERDSADASFDRLGLVETKYMGPFPPDTNLDRPTQRDSADASFDRLGLTETKYMGPFPFDTNAERPSARDSADGSIDLSIHPDPQDVAPLIDAADALDPDEG
jgi:hypothetical protein